MVTVSAVADGKRKSRRSVRYLIRGTSNILKANKKNKSSSQSVISLLCIPLYTLCTSLLDIGVSCAWRL